MHKKLTYILILIAAAAVCLFAAGPWLTAEASSLEEVRQQAAADKDKLAEFREQMKQTEIALEQAQDQKAAFQGQADNLMVRIASLENEMRIIQEQITITQAAIDEATGQITVAEAQIVDAEARLAERQALLEQRVVNLYMYGEISLLDVIFETDSFEDFLVVFDMTQRIMDQDQALLEQIKEERAIIAEKKAGLEQARNELVIAEHEQQDKKTDLQLKKNDYDAALAAANINVAEMEAAEAALEAQSQAIGDDIRALLASANNLLTFGGVLGWPLPSGWTYVTSEFGYRTHPVYGDTRYHAGIDIAADGGTPIYAAAEGIILFSGWNGGYGNCVMIDHGNGIVTLYGHMSAYGSFAVDDSVVRGDTIGYVGTTGTSTGNHLHFEVRQDGNAVDPYNYLNP